jgi:thiol-disulfide isomerase/thioredoxin
MRRLILSGLCIFIINFSSNAQVTQVKESPSTYFSGFQNSRDVDSSLYFARKLASDPRYAVFLQELLHNSFAQAFMKPTQEVVDPIKREDLAKRFEWNKLLLLKMAADPNKRLAMCVRPIDSWVKVQESRNNIVKQRQHVNDFLKEEFERNDFYQNRVGRYALLIQKEISGKAELKDLSQQLLDKITIFLKSNQVKTNTDLASRDILGKRAWFRCLYAYSNNIQGKALLSQGRNVEADIFYQASFDFSPDLVDVNHQSAYFYDMYFLTGRSESYLQEDYLKYILKYNQDKGKTLSTLLKIALVNPKHKDRLRDFYNANFQEKETFGSFWNSSINANLKNNPTFSLNQIDGSKFSTKTSKGKWILIDFWGTWCGPCRQEHPDMQKFYEGITENKDRNLTLITVACRDTESQVASYMLHNKYTFPVAMSDSLIEQTYNINSYPSKILVTPEGKYIVIPFGTDWVGFINGYSTL